MSCYDLEVSTGRRVRISGGNLLPPWSGLCPTAAALLDLAQLLLSFPFYLREKGVFSLTAHWAHGRGDNQIQGWNVCMKGLGQGLMRVLRAEVSLVGGCFSTKWPCVSSTLWLGFIVTVSINWKCTRGLTVRSTHFPLFSLCFGFSNTVAAPGVAEESHMLYHGNAQLQYLKKVHYVNDVRCIHKVDYLPVRRWCI